MAPAKTLRQIPNLISAARILLLPVFVTLCQNTQSRFEQGVDPQTTQWLAMGTLLVIGFSDVLDGFLARTLNWMTPLGKVLDPLADKLAQVTGLTLFTFFAEPPFVRISVTLLAAIVLRDVVLLVGSGILARHGKLEVKPGVSGKAATFATFTLLILVSGGLLPGFVEPLTHGASVLVAISGILYTVRGYRQWRQAVQED